MWIPVNRGYLNTNDVLWVQLYPSDHKADLYPLVAGNYAGIGDVKTLSEPTAFPYSRLVGVVNKEKWIDMGGHEFVNIGRFAHAEKYNNAEGELTVVLRVADANVGESFVFKAARAETILVALDWRFKEGLED